MIKYVVSEPNNDNFTNASPYIIKLVDENNVVKREVSITRADAQAMTQEEFNTWMRREIYEASK